MAVSNPDFSAFDHHCMELALAQAQRGLFSTRPNPRVGCVLARAEQILGVGAHLKAGTPHAEVHALKAAQEAGFDPRGATAYVTLEPCAHFGRTPPCADALIAAGLARVVVACEDPFPAVSGKGIARLKAAGIVVETGLLKSQARDLNVGFFSRIERGRPWLRLKMAQSLDGRTAQADGQSQWLTGPAARADVQLWRARSCAILSASGTVLADDPRLDVRLTADQLGPDQELPAANLKVILDRRLQTPMHARLRQNGPVLFAHACSDSAERTATALEFFTGDFAPDSVLPELLKHLAREHQIGEVWVEAGARLAGGLLRADLVDELLLYQAPLLLGSHARPLAELKIASALGEIPRWQLQEANTFDQDVRLRYLRLK